MMNGNDQAKGKEPVERVVDLFVHMPIGFAVMAWKRVPDLVVSVPGLVNEALSKGCAQIAQAEERLSEEVRKARMIGQVAVTFGGRQLRREVDARLRDFSQTAGGLGSFLPGGGGAAGSGARGDGSNGAGTAAPVSATATPVEPASPAPATTTGATTATKPVKSATAKASKASTATKSAKSATAKSATAKASKATTARKASPAKTATGATRPAAKKTPAATGSSGATKANSPTTAPAAPATAAALPIREYDGLSASQVVSRLTGLTPDELRAVRGYEDGSRARRTVLLAIERLLADAEEAGAGQAP
jgi:hypothetical protein